MARRKKQPAVIAVTPPPDVAGGIIDESIAPIEPRIAVNEEPDFVPPVLTDETAISLPSTYPEKRAAMLEARCDAVNERSSNADGDFTDEEFADLQDMRIAAKRDLLAATNTGNHQQRMEALLHYVGVTMIDCGSARDLGCFVTNYARISRDLAAIDKTKERRQNIQAARNRKRKHNKSTIVKEK